MNTELFKKRLEWAEGRRKFAYEDSVGKLSIGVGRNLDDKGLSDDEIDFLLGNDIDEALVGCRTLSYWDSLTDTRQCVVCDLVFNLGLAKWKEFPKANRALAEGNWQAARAELLDSKYARQVGRRAAANAFAFREDRFPTTEELWQLMR